MLVGDVDSLSMLKLINYVHLLSDLLLCKRDFISILIMDTVLLGCQSCKLFLSQSKILKQF